PRKYRAYRRGDIIVSLAGIAVNIGLFLICAALFAVSGLLGGLLPGLTGSAGIFQQMMITGMWLNLILAFFNLLPIPPLDGSHVFYHLLPPGWGLQYRQLQSLGFIPVIVFVYFLPGARELYLWPARELMQAALSIVGGFAVGVPS
ncbi:MAG: site-2 protease family protein, partial [Gemmatimonadales bacterium]